MWVRFTPKRSFAHDHFEHTLKGDSVPKIERLEVGVFKFGKLEMVNIGIQNFETKRNIEMCGSVILFKLRADIMFFEQRGKKVWAVARKLKPGV